MPGKLLTTTELAAALSVSTKTVHRWLAAKRISPAYTTPGNQYRWDLDDVLKQIKQPRKRDDGL
ncbi:helix-turn-helix domain-containing protein [Pseudonocardia xinjiangensis]|uniref:helix-turn-helix domain-containing protein n=1 Tax=Pseudonocardia xinjiangensis TaxID=75289 RepID=UPI003D91F0EC